MVFKSWDTRKTIDIYLLYFKYLKIIKNFKNREDDFGFYEPVFSRKNQVKSIVFSWHAARQKFYFFSENSWLFFKREQLRQIFVASFYLLFVLSNQIEKMKLFKGRHSVGYLRYMEFFYTLTLDILRMTVFLKVKSL